jgi:3'-phosphoadenosine 5'-phosphosulfate sulfotransferase (PAPS reductase)/FAD synthetase
MTKPRNDIIRENKRILSWGLGVQSTCLAVMSILGDIPPFDFIISSDTGWELPETYAVRDYSDICESGYCFV